MIGNDIVDLQLAKSQSNWQRKGFLEKLFTQEEQKKISNSKNPFLLVWLFWSMKEAAYKIYTQKIEKRFFAPQKFECSLTNENEGFVSFEGRFFYTTTLLSKFYLSTIAKEFQEQIMLFSAICSVKTIDTDLKKKLTEQTGILSEEIEKRKTAIGAPLFYHQKQLLTKSCSISHHGNYGAFAFILENRS